LTISQFDNYGREAVAWLPTLVIDGEPDVVVEVINSKSDELEYSVRINGNRFAPKVFSEGLYMIRWGYPEKDVWKVIDNVKPLNNQDEEELLLSSR
jgi:alkaline phosphatase D